MESKKTHPGRWITTYPFSFSSVSFFELPTYAVTGNCSVKRPCFLSNHTNPPCTEDRGNRLKGILSWAFE